MAGDSETWYVRSADGAVFGPVTRSRLAEWARDSRLAATAEVSRDRSLWQVAETLDELGFDCVAEVSPGVLYGPFPREVVDELRSNGQLADSSRVYVRSEAAAELDKELKLARAKADECEKRASRAESEAKDALRRAEAAEAAAAAKDATLSELHERAERQGETTKRTIQFLESRLAECERAGSASAQAAESKAASDARNLAAARDEVYSTRERAERAESRVAELERSLAAIEKSRARLEAESHAAAERLRVAETEVADLQTQLAAVTRFGATNTATSQRTSDAIEPEIVDDAPRGETAKAAPTGGMPPKAASLAALEAAARRELAAAQKRGFSFFGSRKV